MNHENHSSIIIYLPSTHVLSFWGFKSKFTEKPRISRFLPRICWFVAIAHGRTDERTSIFISLQKDPSGLRSNNYVACLGLKHCMDRNMDELDGRSHCVKDADKPGFNVCAQCGQTWDLILVECSGDLTCTAGLSHCQVLDYTPRARVAPKDLFVFGTLEWRHLTYLPKVIIDCHRLPRIRWFVASAHGTPDGRTDVRSDGRSDERTSIFVASPTQNAPSGQKTYQTL